MTTKDCNNSDLDALPPLAPFGHRYFAIILVPIKFTCRFANKAKRILKLLSFKHASLKSENIDIYKHNFQFILTDNLLHD